MDLSKSVITLTFGDSAENHVGMEKIGNMVDKGKGFSVKDLIEIRERFGDSCELYDLNLEDRKQDEAAVLVIRNGVNLFLKKENKHVELFDEHKVLDVDKKAFMYGRVVNKNARWNLCFDEEGHEPDYEKGKGRVIKYEDIPITKKLLRKFKKRIGEKAENLKGEGNYYYDKNKCGIGFHGDAERRKVIAVRLGGSMPIHYQWFNGCKPIGKRFIIPLNGGDIYIMSEKAVGNDWKTRKIDTLRHATGCDKFTKI